MLAQALQMRMLVVVLDGIIDEAAGRREAVSRFVREVLVPEGFRVVCTSRPEGVNLDNFMSRFVVFDLKPLSEEQQREAIQNQLQGFQTGKAFSDHLTAFAAIRKGHDEVYGRIFSDEKRACIEGFGVPDRFFLKDGARDPAMRLKGPDGITCAATLETSMAVQSKYLQGVCSVLTPELLVKVEVALNDTPNEVETMRHAVHAAMGISEPYLEIETRLALLTLKRRALQASPPTDPQQRKHFEVQLLVAPHTHAAELWGCILSRTDQIYEACEGLLTVNTRVMEALAKEIGLGVDRPTP